MTNNVGISIIGVSVFVSLVCLPLYAVAESWQQRERKKQKEMSEHLSVIKNAFRGDERYMILSAYYREVHYNPLMALRSSFGLLIQIPFFIAAYNFIKNFDGNAGSSFYFIKNLAAPDALFSIGNFTINILPILMTAINIIAGAVYTKGFALHEKIQIYGMALIFLVLLYASPSALVLYWTCNNIFSLGKNIFYKFKKPLVAFYILAVIAVLFFEFYVLRFFQSRAEHKLLAILAGVFVLASPLFFRAIKKFASPRLSVLQENKNLRFSLFFFASTTLFALIALASPSSLFATSPVEFSNIGAHASPFYFLRNTAVQGAGLFLLWPILIYLLFSPIVQSYLALIFASLATLSIFAQFVFRLEGATISPMLIFDLLPDFKTVSLESMINLALIPLVLFLFFFFAKKSKIFKTIFALASLSLFAMSIVNFVKIKTVYADFVKNQNENANEIKPIFHFSKNKQNVLLLMLDRAQSQYLLQIFSEEKKLYEIFSGFTFFPNCVSFNDHTLIGSPPLFGGYDYTPLEINKRPEISCREKHNEALLLLPRIFTEQVDFQAAVADLPWPNYKTFADFSFLENYEKIRAYKTIGTYSKLYETLRGSESAHFLEQKLSRDLLLFSILQSSPIVARDALYNSGKYWNPSDTMLTEQALINNRSALYFLPRLTVCKNTAKNQFIALDNELTHTGDGYRWNKEAILLVGEFFKTLKKNNCYDNTRIIIVADHGGSYYENEFEKDDEFDKKIGGRATLHPLLLYKDFNATGSLKIDNSFMTNADTVSLCLQGFVSKPFNPFTKKSIELDTTKLKKDGVVITSNDIHQPYRMGKNIFTISDNEWFLVKDDIFKKDNWRQLTKPEIDEKLKIK